ncbi:hypothetical protein J6590_033612 [Homalodisca vitripennis]|nr:hypothetical protein J6590_033612 [Homalodisca vitripennis]
MSGTVVKPHVDYFIAVAAICGPAASHQPVSSRPLSVSHGLLRYQLLRCYWIPRRYRRVRLDWIPVLPFSL